jgi:mono/diheme cytochrome c family protein
MSDHSSNISKASTSPHLPGGLAGGEDRLGDEELLNLHERMLREKEEPHEGFSVIPIFLIFLGCLLTYLNGVYLATKSGGFHWDVYSENWTAGEKGAGAVVDPMKAGERIFLAQCKQCHGPEGAGQPGTYPPLAGSPWPVGNPDRPISILLEGMSGPLTVLGQSVNNSMPNVGAGLKDKDIAYVLTYVRNSFGNHADPVDDGEVSTIRAQLGSRAPWTPAEILQTYPLGAAKPAAAPPAGTAPGAASAAGTATTAPAAGAPAGAASTAAAPNAAPSAASATPQAAGAPAATGN